MLPVLYHKTKERVSWDLYLNKYYRIVVFCRPDNLIPGTIQPIPALPQAVLYNILAGTQLKCHKQAWGMVPPGPYKFGGTKYQPEWYSINNQSTILNLNRVLYNKAINQIRNIKQLKKTTSFGN